MRELLGQVLALPDVQRHSQIRGIGLSDWSVLADRLAAGFDYVNTFFHQEPRLDICAIEGTQYRNLDFIISSDVFEHVAPPIERAFKNCSDLLRPGGLLVLTVPFGHMVTTTEHFPDLYDWRVEYRDGVQRLRNVTDDGRIQSFENLVFHGGPGATLEMRVFALSDLHASLATAGFTDIRTHALSYLPFGIYWEYDWSVPITARRSH